MYKILTIALLCASFSFAGDTKAPSPCKGADGKEIACPLVLTREQQLELTTLQQREQVLSLQVQLAKEQLSVAATDFAARTLNGRTDMVLDMSTWSFVPKTAEKK